MTKSETARLAWSIIDAASRDSNHMHQLTAKQWLEIGILMAAVTLAARDETQTGREPRKKK